MKPRLVSDVPDLNVILETMRAAVLPQTGGDPGYTTIEWAEHLGASERGTAQWLGKLHRQGRLIVGKQYRPARDGRMRQFTVYRLAE